MDKKQELRINDLVWIQKSLYNTLLYYDINLCRDILSLYDYWTTDKIAILSESEQILLWTFYIKVYLKSGLPFQDIEDKMNLLKAKSEIIKDDKLLYQVILNEFWYLMFTNKISDIEKTKIEVFQSLNLHDDPILYLEWVNFYCTYLMYTNQKEKAYRIASTNIEIKNETISNEQAILIVVISALLLSIMTTFSMHRDVILLGIQVHRIIDRNPAIQSERLYKRIIGFIINHLVEIGKYRLAARIIQTSMSHNVKETELMVLVSQYYYLSQCYLHTRNKKGAKTLLVRLMEIDPAKLRVPLYVFYLKAVQYRLEFLIYTNNSAFRNFQKLKSLIPKGFSAEEIMYHHTIGNMAAKLKMTSLGMKSFQTYIQLKEQYEIERTKDIAIGYRLKLEMYELKQKLFETQRWAKEKHRFLSEISHDMRSPLTTIQASAEMLQSEHKGNEYIEGMLESSSHLLSFLDDLIDISAVESNEIKIERTQKNISDWLSKWYKQYEHLGAEKGLSTELIIQTSIDLFYTDYKLLRRVLDNLMTNAIKYSSKGKIMITLSSASLANELSIVIQDEGRGMTQEAIESIFHQHTAERKLSNQSHGLGLILAIKLLKMIKGHLKIESEVGVGARCAITMGEL